MPHDAEADPAAVATLGAQAGTLAHDFNNVLGALILNLESLEMLLEPGGKAAELVKMSLDAAAQGTRLTRQLFALAAHLPRETGG